MHEQSDIEIMLVLKHYISDNLWIIRLHTLAEEGES